MAERTGAAHRRSESGARRLWYISPMPKTTSALALAAALVGGAWLARPAAAHHSFAAHFEMDRFVEIEVRVADVDWVNPHILIYAEDSDGETWELEAGPVNLVARLGIDKDRIGIGERIRVWGNPGRGDARTLWIGNILLADNTELLVSPGASPHWEGNAVGDSSGFFAAGDVATPDEDARSFFRVWTPLISGMPRPRGDAVLTAEGERAQARYGIDRQAVGDCEVPGMPFAMMSPYPIELVDADDRIVLRGEAYDLERTILKSAPRTAPAPSPLGLSVARFEDDTLVVETTRIDYHSYGDLGPAQSDRSRVVERFTLSADGTTLDYAITVTDPVILAEPWAWGGSFIAREGAELRPWNCGQDAG